MRTTVIRVNPDDFDPEKLRPAARALAGGRLVAFPTETVYGLGADALNPEAVGRIYEAKGRPSDNPLIVHISDLEQLKAIVSAVPEKARILMETFWPGPLTLILPKSEGVPDETTAGLSTVAVRMPANKIALDLIRLSGVAVAAPSANISGAPSPTCASHVIADLSGRIDCIIDGGCTQVGLESTVLDMTVDPPTVLRPGGVSVETLEAVIGQVNADKVSEVSGNEVPKSPGMKYRHYSPKAEMVLVSGDSDRVAETINRLVEKNRAKNRKTGVLASSETRALYNADVVLCPGSRNSPETIAASIYRCLRDFDQLGVDIIFSETFPEEGIGLAIMNRLRKAASGGIIRLPPYSNKNGGHKKSRFSNPDEGVKP